jgi:LPPG:FO 2-phospho-L-lactate transferase
MDSVVLLSGGSGGAKLARGLLNACDNLTIVANTADEIDERGWGLRDDTWQVMEALERAGHPTWFRLGDRDLAMCLIRTERLRAGEALTEAHRAVVDALGVEARVLPMSDGRVSTWVEASGRKLPFQEFMILEKAEGPVEGVELRGLHQAPPSDAVLQAIAEADAIVIGPSNPVISIGPILALPGMRESLRAAPAPVLAVSPFVGGRALKGPTEPFCEQAGIAPSAAGIARAYGDVIDGIVADEPSNGTPELVTDTLMATAEDRVRLAREVLDFAASVSPTR